MHCPPGQGLRPRDTGWYAAFGNLADAQQGQVGYSTDGWRFMGSTFDPSGLYRFNAVMRWLRDEGITPAIIHAHAKALQQHFVQRIAALAMFDQARLVVPPDEMRRGNFLTFETPRAQDIHADLKQRHVITDVRGHRLRIGFGLYQTLEEVDELVRRMEDSSAVSTSVTGASSAA
jgi:selenocysteine lyase/cysteine desulfurase